MQQESPLQVSEMLDLAKSFSKDRNWKKSAYYCRMVLQGEPGNETAILFLSRAVEKLGMKDLAAELLVSVFHTVRMRPRWVHISSLIRYGLIRVMQGKPREALSFYWRVGKYIIRYIAATKFGIRRQPKN